MKKEPFLQVSKRRNKARWQERLLIRFIALILALIVCGAVIVALVKMNPVDVYKAIWDGAMGSDRRLWQTIRDTMVLLCISIGLAPAFKMKFWNIGAEGSGRTRNCPESESASGSFPNSRGGCQYFPCDLPPSE